MTTQAVQDRNLYPTRAADAPGMTRRQHPTVRGAPTDGPLWDNELDEHERAGYTIVPELISADEMETFSAELDRLAADESLRGDERAITERESGGLRSIFEVQRFSTVIDELARDPRVLGRARQLLGSEVYLHQTRVNYMPGFAGSGFYWHSDFETWHAEDGMPAPRAVSCSIALTHNYPFNGG